MTHKATTQPRTRVLGVMKLKKLVDPSLVIITIFLVCLIYAQ